VQETLILQELALLREPILVEISFMQKVMDLQT